MQNTLIIRIQTFRVANGCEYIRFGRMINRGMHKASGYRGDKLKCIRCWSLITDHRNRRMKITIKNNDSNDVGTTMRPKKQTNMNALHWYVCILGTVAYFLGFSFLSRCLVSMCASCVQPVAIVRTSSKSHSAISQSNVCLLSAHSLFTRIRGCFYLFIILLLLVFFFLLNS